jgi:hypothetical protein
MSRGSSLIYGKREDPKLGQGHLQRTGQLSYSIHWRTVGAGQPFTLLFRGLPQSACAVHEVYVMAIQLARSFIARFNNSARP